MTSARRAFYGALGGLGGTLALTGFRKVMAGFGLVGQTAPEQVIERLEELRVLNDLSPEARDLLGHIAADAVEHALPGYARPRDGSVASVGMTQAILEVDRDDRIVLDDEDIGRTIRTIGNGGGHRRNLEHESFSDWDTGSRRL